MVKKIKIIALLILSISFFPTFFVSAQIPQFEFNYTSGDTMANWLSAKPVGFNQLGQRISESNVGNNVYFIDGKRIGIRTDNFRINNTYQLGQIPFGVNQTTGNLEIGYYKRYTILFDVFISTALSTSDVFGNVARRGLGYSRRLAEVRDKSTYNDQLTAVKYLQSYGLSGFSSSWRSNNKRFQGNLLMGLEVDLLSIPTPFNVPLKNGELNFTDYWIGFTHVFNPDSANLGLGRGFTSAVQADYNTFQSGIPYQAQTITGGGVDTTHVDTSPYGISGYLPKSSAGLTAFNGAGYNKVPVTLWHGARNGAIFTSPYKEYDLFEFGEQSYKFTFDTAKSGTNRSQVFFPYPIDLQAQARVRYNNYNWKVLYLEEDVSGILWAKRWDLTNQYRTNYGFNYNEYFDGYIRNVYQKQTLALSIDMFSKYEYIPDPPIFTEPDPDPPDPPVYPPPDLDGDTLNQTTPNPSENPIPPEISTLAESETQSTTIIIVSVISVGAVVLIYILIRRRRKRNK